METNWLVLRCQDNGDYPLVNVRLVPSGTNVSASESDGALIGS
jgi:hypothetical protein